MDYNKKFVVTYPVSHQSEILLNEKNHALLGISPFNSYFSEEMIGAWIKWALLTFKSFHLFIPDTLPVYTFLALGHEELKAQKKAKRQASYLKNKVYRALARNKISEEAANQLIIDMSFLEKNSTYQQLKEKCRNLYLTNPSFQKECDLSTGWVLSGQSVKNEEQNNPNIAINYILAEMPLFIDSPSILNVSSSLFFIPSNSTNHKILVY